MSPTLSRARCLSALRELGVEISFAWPRFRSAFPYDWSREADFMDGLQQRRRPQGTVGVHAGSGDGSAGRNPLGTGETGLSRASRTGDRCPSGEQGEGLIPRPRQPVREAFTGGTDG